MAAPSPSSLNVIALISGGKDSLFSILHCLANGHAVVALANLHPRVATNGEDSVEDIDSYMYQTVGHAVIPLYEEALDIPLYRQEIVGSAVNTDRDYATPADGSDETESLVPLLKKVKVAHPEANAISTGAILSTYQRTRVECVALRLGLTPLSYLWRYPFLPPYSQSALLHDMAAVGQDARIIKVASGGLDQSFLWANVADSRTIARLGKAMARFGDNEDGAVLGEGGEFETLALDGPSVLWRKKIEIEDDGAVVGEGGSAIFKGRNAKTVVKEEKGGVGLESLRLPSMWDDEFKSVLDSLSTSEPSHQAPSPTSTTITSPCTPSLTIHSTHSTFTIANLASPNDAASTSTPTNQTHAILSNLESILTTQNLRPTSITHVTVLLRRISDFANLNPIYGSLFTAPNPPSRVTVACGAALPPGTDVMLSAIISRAEQRPGLHVQGRSYWAPANIGPYSQAIGTPLPLSGPGGEEQEPGASPPEAIYVAGQIPLVPASMEVFAEAGFHGQVVLALQHLWRVGAAMRVRWWTCGLAYLSACPAEEAQSRVQTAQQAWEAIHTHHLRPADADSDSADEGGDVDPWDLKNRGTGPAVRDTTRRAPLPDPAALISQEEEGHDVGRRRPPPPCFVVQVEELPRNVDVEWHSTGVAGGQISTRRAEDVHVTAVLGTETLFFSAAVLDEEEDMEGLEERVRRALGATGSVEWEHIALYTAPGSQLGCRALEKDGTLSRLGVQWVPCHRVWGEAGREVLGVVVGRVSVRTNLTQRGM